MPRILASSALQRFRVLDLSRVRAGPTCVRVFADFAATLCAELATLTIAKGESSVDGRPAWHHGNSRRASSWLTHR